MSEDIKLNINGKVGLREISEFLDTDDIVIRYKGLELPKISNLNLETIEDGNRIVLRSPRLFYKHILSWIKKAKSEKTGFDKFFALWVAFNSFYNFYYERIKPKGREGDKKRLKKPIEHLITDSEASALLQILSQKINSLLSQPYEIKIRRDSGRDRRNIKAELKRELDKRKLNKPTLKLLVLALYGIRNNLFHGGEIIKL